MNFATDVANSYTNEQTRTITTDVEFKFIPLNVQGIDDRVEEKLEPLNSLPAKVTATTGDVEKALTPTSLQEIVADANNATNVGTSINAIGLETTSLVVRTHYKSARSITGWAELAKHKQFWRSVNVLGKSGTLTVKILSTTGTRCDGR